MLSPGMAAAHSMDRMTDPCLAEAGIGPGVVAEMLEAQGQAVANGDLAQVRRTLAAQVVMLDRMFHHLFSLAMTAQKHSHDLFERYLRLALKAQAQAARTSLVLRRLSPPAPADSIAPEQVKRTNGARATASATPPAPPSSTASEPTLEHEVPGSPPRPSGGSARWIGLSAQMQ